MFDATSKSAPAPAVRFLPLGLCLKETDCRVIANEANALRLVEGQTNVPAPRFIDFTMQDDIGFLLMTRVFGDRLDKVFYRVTNEERKELGRELGRCISQLRQIPNTSKYQIANTLGGPAYDHRFEDKHCVPFNSDGDFFDYLTEYLEKERHERPLSVFYDRKHRTYFTHSDLHRTNIFVQAGRLSGIIDWEHAGFKPEFWEYTKSLWSCRARKDQKDILREAFDEDYEDELEAEMFLWRTKPVF